MQTAIKEQGDIPWYIIGAVYRRMVQNAMDKAARVGGLTQQKIPHQGDADPRLAFQCRFHQSSLSLVDP